MTDLIFFNNKNKFYLLPFFNPIIPFLLPTLLLSLAPSPPPSFCISYSLSTSSLLFPFYSGNPHNCLPRFLGNYYIYFIIYFNLLSWLYIDLSSLFKFFFFSSNCLSSLLNSPTVLVFGKAESTIYKNNSLYDINTGIGLNIFLININAPWYDLINKVIFNWGWKISIKVSRLLINVVSLKQVKNFKNEKESNKLTKWKIVNNRINFFK